MKRSTFITALLMVAVAAPAQAGLFDKAPKPVVLEAQGNRAAEFKQLVGDDSALDKVAKLGVPDPAKVAIAKIRLNFPIQSSEHETENGKGNYEDYNLLNVTPEDVQKMADIFYADLVKLLTSKGYVVQSQDYLLSDASFAAAVAKTKSPESSEALMKKEKTITAYAKQTGQFSGMNDGYMDYFSLSKAKSDALLVELDFDMGFVTFSKASDRGVWFQAHEIESKPVLHVKKGFIRAHANGKGTQFAFVEKVMLPGEVFAGVEKKASSGVDTAAMIFLALQGGLGHSNGSYNVTPVANFPEAVAKSLQPLAEVVVNGLPQLTAAPTSASTQTAVTQ